MFVIAALLLIGLMAALLISPGIENLKQPKTKKKVFELSCDGVIARWMVRNHWGAFTLPLPFFVLIFYWMNDSATERLDPFVRIHEFIHVAQDERTPFFLVSWALYIYELVRLRFKTKSWLTAYIQNKYEAEAYDVENKCIAGKTDFPDWAQD